MLLLGHLGITLGAAMLLDAAITKNRPLSTGTDPQPEQTPQTRPSLLSRIDMRLLFIGALLPDIIDKPVGAFLFRDTFDNGRIYTHTLLFLILITLAAFHFRYHYKKTWLLVLTFGAFMHLILDQMWHDRQTLLWPIYGFAFEKLGLTDVVELWFNLLETKPAVYVPEIIGGMILSWFSLTLLRRRKITAFITKGKI